ncbi:MAG: adenylate/guanylate cyclase domain-containing protein [Betaproteobacteria bacterium]|nr:adenylate/guanylate cyclase domain-containing protein [Betaproteobacteria bacterium]
MNNDQQELVASGRRHDRTAIVLLIVVLLGLPIAVWLDVRSLTQSLVVRQANELNSMISSIRRYYSANVVARVLSQSGGEIKVLHNYDAVPGAIPIPATLSLELSAVIGEKQSNLAYRFVSDFPFRDRATHALDDFERSSLEALRAKPEIFPLVQSTFRGLQSEARLISPVIMGAACVSCHNSHPQSTKRDWKVGDVRGIQEVTVSQPIALSLWSFKFSLVYFLCVASVGLAFIFMQRRQNASIRDVNRELEGANQFLAAISMKISHYLSPQIYKSIFSGEMDVSLQTQRKKLTIFFSDIKDFTALTEGLQPEDLTALINEYFTEMSAIALKHGGTIDKFIGDAILVFFGDPNTLGASEDAKACVRMAIEMQHRLAELNIQWRKRGAETPFRVRMGINTGFCSVGNFGSADRMDYTILGAEVNLSARLQSIAPPGGIVVSYETYAHVRDLVAAHSLPAVTMKGIAREVVPYAIEGLMAPDGTTLEVFSEHSTGLDLYMDLGRIDKSTSESVRSVLNQAISALDRQKGQQST